MNVREIKFRAWDTILEEMLSMQKIEQIGMSLFALCEGLKIVKLMQYAGVDDKKGIEIYEGDIVKKPHYSDGRRKINCEIKFVDGEFVIDCVDYDQSVRMATDVEVIGNIFENPELLEEPHYGEVK